MIGLRQLAWMLIKSIITIFNEAFIILNFVDHQRLELASQGYIENIRKTVDDIYNKEKQSVSSFQLLNLKFQNDRVSAY